MIGPAKASGLTSREIAEAIPARCYQPSSSMVASAAKQALPAVVALSAQGSGSQKVRGKKVCCFWWRGSSSFVKSYIAHAESPLS